jgi:hypothetical protein
MKGKSRTVKKQFITSIVALVLLVGALAPDSFAQRKRGARASAATNQATTSSPLNALPASDAVMLVDIKRVLNDVLPRVLANDPAHLTKINAEIDKFKTNYGLDMRSFERLAVGLRFQSPRAGVTTTDMVAIVSGTFESGALLAAGRMAAKGKYQEEKYRNSVIYIYDVTEQGKAPSVMGMRETKLAVAALDPHTLVFGEPEGVRSTIGASLERRRVNADLIQLAMRNPNAFVSFGANVPASLTQGKDFGNEEIAKNIASIRQAYGALGLTTGGFDLLAIARTARPEQAKSLGDTLSALKQFGGMAIAQMPADKRAMAQTALDSLTITTEGNETSLRLEVAQAAIEEIMRGMRKQPGSVNQE